MAFFPVFTLVVIDIWGVHKINVDYKMIFLLEFIFGADVSLDSKVEVIKKFQEFFNKI